MVKEIKLYVARDPASTELLRNFALLIRSLPKDLRPRLKVRVVKINDPKDFPNFLAQLEEIFGGLYTLEFRKYNIKAIPAIVIEGRKVLEGHIPTMDEIKDILLREGVIEYKPSPSVTAPEEVKEAKMPSIEAKPQILHEEKEAVVPEPIYEKPPLETHLRVEETPSKQLSEEKIIEEKTIPLEPTPIVQAERELKPERPLKQSVEKPITEEQLAEREAKPPASHIKGTCYDCIFYTKERSRCTLYHVYISDPMKPVCGRKPK